MEQHLNNVLQEAASTKKLVDTRRKDMQNQKEKLMSGVFFNLIYPCSTKIINEVNELNFHSTDKREKSRLNEEISKIQKLNQDTKDRMSSKQNLIFKKQKKIEQIKDQVIYKCKFDNNCLMAICCLDEMGAEENGEMAGRCSETRRRRGSHNEIHKSR